MSEPDLKRFVLVLVKPSHYDDEGYVIQLLRSSILSNSLAVLNGLALECAHERILGDDVEIEIHAFDETNSRIRPERIASLIEGAEGGTVLLVGVQSNQFPRAIDIATPLRQRGIMVAIGGFYFSGAKGMLKEQKPHVRRAPQVGRSFFAGGGGGRPGHVVRDCWAR